MAATGYSFRLLMLIYLPPKPDFARQTQFRESKFVHIQGPRTEPYFLDHAFSLMWNTQRTKRCAPPTEIAPMTILALPSPGAAKARLAKAAALILPVAALALAAGTAYAGTDATFTTALTKFTGFLQGSGGKIITVLSLAAGLISLASGRFTLGQIAVPVGVGVGVGTGVPIVTSVITAVI